MVVSEQRMDSIELLKKIEFLSSENRRLIKENERLKAQLGIALCKPDENTIPGPTAEKFIHDDEPTDRGLFPGVNSRSDATLKIKLFMSLFKGRDDVYARKWENKRKGTSGYSPSCVNEWKPGLCDNEREVVPAAAIGSMPLWTKRSLKITFGER